MENYIVVFLTKNSWLPWVILSILVIMIFIAIIQGRKISIAGFEFGPKVVNSPQSFESPHSISLVNNIYPDSSTKLSEEEYEEIYQRVIKRWEKEHPEKSVEIDARIHFQPEPSEVTVELFKIQYAIENKVKDVVRARVDGWAGISLANVRTLLDLGVSQGFINEKLLQEIESYYLEISPGAYPEGSYSRIQIIALDILRQLDLLVTED